MDGLILAAGFGTRLGCRPKAFLPVGGSTALDLACMALCEADVPHAVVVHNARWAAGFHRWYRESQWPDAGLSIELLNDGAWSPEDRSGAVGDLLLGLQALQSDVVLLMVDNVFTWPLCNFLTMAGVTCPAIACRAMRRGYEDLGRVDLDDLGAIRNFYHDTLPGGRPWAGRVWLGPASLPADVVLDVLLYVEEARAEGVRPDSLGRFVSWLARRRPVRGIDTNEGEAWDIGTTDGLTAAQEVLGP